MRDVPMLEFPLDEYEARINKLFGKLEEAGCSAAIMANEENLRYFCDYRTSAWNSEFLYPAMLAAVPGRLVLVTSTRMRPTALATCCLGEEDIFAYDGFGEAASPEVLAGAMADALKRLGADKGRLGLEPGAITRMRVAYNDYKDILAALPDMEPTDFSLYISALREIKSPREIEIIRKNCGNAVEAFKIAVDKVVLGETTEEDFYHNYVAASYDLGSDDFSLQLVVEFGPDRQQPNVVPSSRVYSDPDWCIYADSGPTLKGYASDMIRIAKLKAPTKEQQELFDVCLNCHAACIPMVKPGTQVVDFSRAHDDYMREHGVADICLSMNTSGHGIGQDVHEMPIIKDSFPGKEFEAGMTFAFEPTVIHHEFGQFVIENNYVVTEDGCENMTPQLQYIYVPERS